MNKLLLVMTLCLFLVSCDSRDTTINCNEFDVDVIYIDDMPCIALSGSSRFAITCNWDMCGCDDGECKCLEEYND